jgi:LysR family transcriptional regulator, regulator of abg operon
VDMLAGELNKLASRLRFRHFQLLVALAREGSLRAAAQEMHVTQPALSRMLEELESALGSQLFVRSSRGLTPTTDGVTATRSARYILEELWRVPQELRLRADATAQIRIGAPHPVAHGLLSSAIARLTAHRPRIHVELIERAVPDLFIALQNGEAEVLVTTYSPKHLEAVQVPLQQERLCETKYELVAPGNHHLANLRTPVPLARLMTEDWILPRPETMLREEIEWTFRRAGLSPPVPIVQASNPVTSIGLVAAGVGIAFVPIETLQNVQPSMVARIRTSPSPPSAPVALFFRANRMNEQIMALRSALGL